MGMNPKGGWSHIQIPGIVSQCSYTLTRYRMQPGAAGGGGRGRGVQALDLFQGRAAREKSRGPEQNTLGGGGGGGYDVIFSEH